MSAFSNRQEQIYMAQSGEEYARMHASRHKRETIIDWVGYFIKSGRFIEVAMVAGMVSGLIYLAVTAPK